MRLTMAGAAVQMVSIMPQPMTIATHKVRAVIFDTCRFRPSSSPQLPDATQDYQLSTHMLLGLIPATSCAARVVLAPAQEAAWRGQILTSLALFGRASAAAIRGVVTTMRKLKRKLLKLKISCEHHMTLHCVE